jgi:hypothetical protein
MQPYYLELVFYLIDLRGSTTAVPRVVACKEVAVHRVVACKEVAVPRVVACKKVAVPRQSKAINIYLRSLCRV